MLQRDNAKSKLTVVALATLAFTFSVVEVALPGARTLPPPSTKIFHGVTDSGDISGFKDFSRAVGRKPPVIQTFHSWGNSFSKALPRWRRARARPILHVTTRSETGAELITPRQIANGEGDDYLIELNKSFRRARTPAYLRPMGEPNRCKNLYAGVDCSGQVRGGSYAFGYYRSAFRRIATIVRGGARRKVINARLRRLGQPGIRKVNGMKRLPGRLRSARVAMIWSPLPNGSPGVAANRPTNYWPGGRWVDWVGTTFDSRYSKWKYLSRFYRAWAEKRKKPMALAEWWLSSDNPGFVRRLFKFVRKNPRTRMLVFYQDFGSSNPFRLQNFPRALRAYSKLVSTPRFPRYAPGFPRPWMEPPAGGISPRKTPGSR